MTPPKPVINTREVRFSPPARKVEVRAAAEGGKGPGTIAGYAAVFDSWSEDLGGFREKIRKGAFARSVEELDVRCLVDHEQSLILGRKSAGTLRISEDEVGLKFECDLADTRAGNDIAESIGRGDVTGCSFGFAVVADEWAQDEAGAVSRELIEVHVFDVGPVTFPAYPDTEVAVRSLGHFRSNNVLSSRKRTRARMRQRLRLMDLG